MADLSKWKERQTNVLVAGGLTDEVRGQIQGVIGMINIISALYVK